MAPNSTAASALSVLTTCNLKELHLYRADGSRILDTLHETCRAAGLIPPGTPGSTPLERYLAIFDAALNGGLGCWVLDYVEVVCADRHLTSNDPLEAYLLDGGFVKAWAQGALQRAEQALNSALSDDSVFRSFRFGQLQQNLAHVRTLAAVLRALDRIRAAASTSASGGVRGSLTGAGSAAGHDRHSVKEELRLALLLEQAFQVMDWCYRQGLAEPHAATTSRYNSIAEWSRAVNARRSRAAPRPLFLDMLLQSLSLSGAYPATSVQHMLHTLLVVVRQVDPPAWEAKLALLAYFLLDAGMLEATAGSAGGTSSRPSSLSSGSTQLPVAVGGSGRVEVALEALRRVFRLPAGEVAMWQFRYLLDCAAPDSPGNPPDPHLARACELLPSCVTAVTPFEFIEALLALGRPDVALAVDRGQSGSQQPASSSSGSGGVGVNCRTLPQALTLLEIRLRCGLLTEAFMLLRQHSAALAASGADPDTLTQHTRALLRRLAGWAAEEDATANVDRQRRERKGRAGEAATEGQEAMETAVTAVVEVGATARGSEGAEEGDSVGGWLNHLTQLPMNSLEESVLVGWLAEEAEAGRPAGDFLPLFFLQRGRTNEATAAWGRWEARQTALAAASGARRAPQLAELISAALDAAHTCSVALPLRSLAVAAVGDPTEPLPALLAHRPMEQGATGVLGNLRFNMTTDQPLAALSFHGNEPPPLITSVVQPPPPPFLQPAPAPAHAPPGNTPTTADALSALTSAARSAQQDITSESPTQSQAHSQPPAHFVPYLPELPSAAPFRAPPPQAGSFGMDYGGVATGGGGGLFRPGPFGAPGGGGIGGVGGGGGGAGTGLLFSVGTGAASVATGGGVGGSTPVGGASRSKRAKPNAWM